MNSRLTRIALAAGIAAASVLAVPSAASASNTIYPPTGACSVTPSTSPPGGTVSFSCVAGTFSPSETVTVTVTGENGAATGFGMMKFAVTTGSASRTSTAAGALPTVAVTLPSNATGVYNIAALSATSAGGQASVTISSSGGSSNLPATGSDGSQLLGLWVGGGALLLAGGAVAVAATVRRTHRRPS